MSYKFAMVPRLFNLYDMDKNGDWAVLMRPEEDRNIADVRLNSFRHTYLISTLTCLSYRRCSSLPEKISI